MPAYLQSVHCRFTPRSAAGSVRAYPSSRARGFLPQFARGRTAHGNIFLPILYVVSRIITSQLSHAAADRCLQTSKPVSQALNVPIYAEHGEPMHASSRDVRLMGPLSRTLRMVLTSPCRHRSASSSRLSFRAADFLWGDRSQLEFDLVPQSQGRGRR